jgi:NAD+ synthase (glutamine-hydrolysing)
MPTHFNSETTKGIARKLAEELGVTFREIPIEDAFEREAKATEAMLSPGETLTPLARQNIQARIRGMRMWNWANASRGMWLQTGNMSEKAVGYTTIGGDLMGAYSLLGNLPKTIVIRLLDYLREKHRFEALEELMKTEASAELAENQEDERDLMPFPVLDACFALFAGEKMMPVDLYRAIRAMWTDEELRKMRPDYRPGMLKDWVKRFCRLFVGSIFKWVQAPQAVHLGVLDLDRERALQIPVVQSPEWLEIDAIDSVLD